MKRNENAFMETNSLADNADGWVGTSAGLALSYRVGVCFASGKSAASDKSSLPPGFGECMGPKSGRTRSAAGNTRAFQDRKAAFTCDRGLSALPSSAFNSTH